MWLEHRETREAERLSAKRRDVTDAEKATEISSL
jgi:hypothetical protein